MGYAQIPAEDEELAHEIIGAAIEVHRISAVHFSFAVAGGTAEKLLRRGASR